MDRQIRRNPLISQQQHIKNHKSAEKYIRPPEKTQQQPKSKADKYVYDEIGLKIRCQFCQNYFYYFETNEHRVQCNKHKHQVQPQNLIHPKVEVKPQPQIARLEEEEQLLDIKQIENAPIQRNEAHELELAELNRFQQAKMNISRIVEIKKSRLQNKLALPKEEQFDKVPCPFCHRGLKLDQLDHTDNCPKSSQCNYCKQKIIAHLMYSHWKICIPKLQSNKQRLRPKPNLQEKPKEKKIEVKNNHQSKQGKLNNLKPTYMRSLDRLPQIAKQNEREQQEFRPEERPIPEYYELNPVKLVEKYSRPKEKPQRINKPKQQAFSAEIGISLAELNNQSLVRAIEKNGLPKAVLNQLQRIQFSGQMFENQKSCSICWLDYNQGEELVLLNCSHIFHPDCLIPHFSSHTGCPYCKAKVSP